MVSILGIVIVLFGILYLETWTLRVRVHACGARYNVDPWEGQHVEHLISAPYTTEMDLRVESSVVGLATSGDARTLSWVVRHLTAHDVNLK